VHERDEEETGGILRIVAVSYKARPRTHPNTYAYTYIYICICIYVYVYVYVYIHLWRAVHEKNAGRTRGSLYIMAVSYKARPRTPPTAYTYTCIYIHIHVYIYIYMYIYIYTYGGLCMRREMQGEREEVYTHQDSMRTYVYEILGRHDQ